MAGPERFYIAGRIDPSRSLVGQACRRRWPDPLEASARFWLVAIGIVALLFVGVSVAWAVAPRVPEVGIIQAIVILSTLSATFAGWRPSIRIDVHAGTLTVSRSRQEVLALSVSEIQASDIVDSRTYYRHYRRYGRTLAFPGKPGDPLVLIRTAERPILVGIQPAEQDRFVERLHEMPSSKLTARVA